MPESKTFQVVKQRFERFTEKSDSNFLYRPKLLLERISVQWRDRKNFKPDSTWIQLQQQVFCNFSFRNHDIRTIERLCPCLLADPWLIHVCNVHLSFRNWWSSLPGVHDLLRRLSKLQHVRLALLTGTAISSFQWFLSGYHCWDEWSHNLTRVVFFEWLDLCHCPKMTQTRRVGNVKWLGVKLLNQLSSHCIFCFAKAFWTCPLHWKVTTSSILIRFILDSIPIYVLNVVV